jgi:hypothetical protein
MVSFGLHRLLVPSQYRHPYQVGAREASHPLCQWAWEEGLPGSVRVEAPLDVCPPSQIIA